MWDRHERFITFSMTCIIGAAICCLLLTSIMAGVALGYNYSLAEYIDLKETNVSVYLKRGIFDDEIGAEGEETRRSGSDEFPTNNQNNDIPGDSKDKVVKDGRRLDQSIYESEENNKFEGLLLKLTKDVTTTESSESEDVANFRRSKMYLDPMRQASKPVPTYSAIGDQNVISGRSGTLIDEVKNEILLRPNESVTQKDLKSRDQMFRKPSRKSQSGRREFMADYNAIENVPMPYAARRSGANPVYPLNIFNKEQLDRQADKIITPKPVAVDGHKPTRTDAPTGFPELDDESNKRRMQYSDLELPNMKYKIKSPSEDYIDDDFNKIPIRRKRKT